MTDQNETEREFWMVWNGGANNAPRMRHNSLASAQAEAMRLAVLNPKTTFYVLKAINAYRAEIEIKTVFLDSAPAEGDTAGAW